MGGPIVRVLRGLYEGPGSHGVLRVAASMRGVHAVLRAYPGDWSFPALYGVLARGGEPAPVSLSPIAGAADGARAPGDPERDLSEAARRSPGAEAVVFTRSEPALLAGEGAPVLSLPANEETGMQPRLVILPWESPGVREVEAADLALAELVRAHTRPYPRSLTPTVNIFGPAIFGPNAAAEVAEMERLLNLIGVGVNAKVPLGATVGDLSRLARAWANVVLYREVGESATLYLQDEFGMPRVTTPPLGSAGTGAVLRAVGELCSLEGGEVRRAAWAELARTAGLPWYARLAVPETFRGKRAVLFGDLTYTTGLGYTLAREIGLEVAWAGTYVGHLEKDFLLHAAAFTDEAFVEDDPGAVAARVEDTAPDLLVGTHLEGEVADALGLPFLPLCPPATGGAFAERPLMGYVGGSVLADMLDDALRRRASPRTAGRSPEGQRARGEGRARRRAARGHPWNEEALTEP